MNYVKHPCVFEKSLLMENISQKNYKTVFLIDFLIIKDCNYDRLYNQRKVKWQIFVYKVII